MNWRRGLLRLWLACSIAWLSGVAWFLYDRQAKAAARASIQESCVSAKKANPLLGNPFDCFDGGIEFGDLVTIGPLAKEFAMLALTPILGSLLVGLALIWILSGFRSPTHKI